jgi:hypothetical protein
MNITEFFGLKESEIKNTKLHFATGNTTNDEALDEFLKGTIKEWQAKKNFNRKYILTLIYLKSNEWLYAGIYEALDVEEISNGKCKYKTFLTEKGKEYIGRLVINFNKDFRQSYPYCENYINQFKLVEVRRDEYQVIDFPGYEDVNIPFETLKLIIEMKDRSWKSALSSVQGIYLISDRTNGKLYVGSAYGEDNFWQRWSSYVKTGHGNNKELKDIYNLEGYDYFNNFTFSIIEVYKNTTDFTEIIKRETHWKNLLMTREFGYNNN